MSAGRRGGVSLLAMLKSTSGRDLLLHVGSASADVLYYELTGIAVEFTILWPNISTFCHSIRREQLLTPAIDASEERIVLPNGKSSRELEADLFEELHCTDVGERF